MSAPSIVLNKGQIVLTEVGNSTIGIELQNSPFLVGLVAIVNDLTDSYSVNDVVLFNPSGATKFAYSGENYFLTTEDKLFYKEVALP